MPSYVYKYVYEGDVVYVGKCDSDLSVRIARHRYEDKFKPYLSSDIYYVKLANPTMSDVIESLLIREYKPILNIAKTCDWDGFAPPRLSWKKYFLASLKA